MICVKEGSVEIEGSKIDMIRDLAFAIHYVGHSFCGMSNAEVGATALAMAFSMASHPDWVEAHNEGIEMYSDDEYMREEMNIVETLQTIDEAYELVTIANLFDEDESPLPPFMGEMFGISPFLEDDEIVENAKALLSDMKNEVIKEELSKRCSDCKILNINDILSAKEQIHKEMD